MDLTLQEDMPSWVKGKGGKPDLDLTLQEDMPNWVKEKGRPPGLGFDSMREGACQSQRK